MIKRIKIKNFKSFKSIEIDLSNLNVIIGQNASGKSNFVSVFQFIRDIALVGLSNAISLQGGMEYLINFNSNVEDPLEVEIEFEEKSLIFIPRLTPLRISNLIYNIQLFPSKGKKGLKKFREEVTMRGRIKGREEEIRIVSDNGRIEDASPSDLVDDIFPYLNLMKNPRGKLTKVVKNIAEIPPISFILGAPGPSIQIYDFDPKLSKKAIPITGRVDLEPDGSNTALVLKSVLSDNEERKRFLRYLSVCLPFIREISVETQADKSLLFKILETYNSKTKVPAPLISDGTIEIISIVYALFFSKNRLIVIEEPERNIHPRLISNLASLIKEASQTKQIVITTHHPELLKYIELDHIYLISREQNGNSNILKASNIEELNDFIRKNIYIGDVITDGLIG